VVAWSVRLVRPARHVGGENDEIARSGSLLFALDERKTLLPGTLGQAAGAAAVGRWPTRAA